MNVILNGISDDRFLSFENDFEKKITGNDHYFKLREMNINYCTGCWDCWLKNPGICTLKDDFESILSKVPTSDSITIITPVIAGYESALMKTAKDRMVSLAHPYIEMYKGEQHHRQRYTKKLTFKLLIVEDEDTKQEDIELVKETYDRVMLNYHGTMESVTVIEKGDEVNYVSNAC